MNPFRLPTCPTPEQMERHWADVEAVLDRKVDPVRLALGLEPVEDYEGDDEDDHHPRRRRQQALAHPLPRV